MPVEIRPHPGPQTAFLACNADIAGYGGTAGGGKTVMLLWDQGRWASTVRDYKGVIFRKTYADIFAPGALWDESMIWLPKMGGIPVESDSLWVFPKTNSAIKFSHLQRDKNVHNWQGSQPAGVSWDEVTHFNQHPVMYMLSRLRSKCGVKPYMRMTMNPDPGSWVSDFFSWWIDQDTGLAIPERSGAIRWMAQRSGAIIWADTKEELTQKGMKPLSVSFIKAGVNDNPSLDADYIDKLENLSMVDRARLLEGNWKIKAVAGSFFKRNWFKVYHDQIPGDIVRVVRCWDRAATEASESSRDPDWTAGFKVGIRSSGTPVLIDCARIRSTPGNVQSFIKSTAEADGRQCEIVLSQDPGQAGVVEVQALVKFLQGFAVHTYTEKGAKADRAKPLSSQCEHGNVELVRGAWLEPFFLEAESFLDERETKAPAGYHDDQIDAASGAYNFLTSAPVPRIRTL